jgi:hypothetical protein
MEEKFDWLDFLYNRAQTDPWYCECLRVCHEREAVFLEIREKLTPTEQDALDLYIDACEELQFSLVQLAYFMDRACCKSCSTP